jgi:RNA polymerase sigma-70 factor (ECF subfamily)
MDRAEPFALPQAVWERELLQEAPAQQLVLDLYDRERIPLLRYLTAAGTDREAAREIVQESFLKLHLHLLQAGDRANLRAWLYRVCRNLAINERTAHRNSHTGSFDAELTGGDYPSSRLSAEEELMERERVHRLNRRLGALSEAQRECLTLRAQGLKYREIAQVLGIATSTVAENVQRGLSQLKDLL